MKKLYAGIITGFLIFNTVSYSSIAGIINKIDNKVNPEIRFDTKEATGKWYLLFDNDPKTRNFKNISIILEQQGQGYNYITNSYNVKRQIWMKDEKRAWIEEDKNNVYFYIRKKGPLSYKNKILYYDRNMEYLVIYFENENVIRVLSRNKTSDKKEADKILETLKKQGYNIRRLKSIDFDFSLENNNENEKEKEEKEFYDRLARFGESGTIDFDQAVEVPKK